LVYKLILILCNKKEDKIMYYRKSIAYSITALSICVAHFANAEEVSGSTAKKPAGIEDVLVTAQRRKESAQSIPVAISAYGADQLEKSGVVSIEQVAIKTPGAYFSSFGALRPQLYIRGIGTRSFDPGSESSVGVFVDETYLGRASGSFGSLKDIERIEVLRGPQGTLYGRNTIGGAINVITKGPTDEFEGVVEAGISNFDGYEIFGAAGGPLNEDGSIKFRTAVWNTERDGYVTNLATGTDFQGVENRGGRLSLVFEPSDNLSINLKAEFVHDGDKAGFGGINQGTFGNPDAVFFAHPNALPNLVSPQSSRAGILNQDPLLDRDASTFITRVDYDTDVATLTSITSYRTVEAFDSRDLDGSSLDAISQIGDEESKQLTQEFRLTSNPDGGMSFGGEIDWIIGGFYYEDESDREDTFMLGSDSAVGASIDSIFAGYESESYAVFGQVTIHVTERVDLTLGGRYTKDKKTTGHTGITLDALPLIRSSYDTENSASYSSTDPRVVLSYKAAEDINLYASYSTGFKSGGFQFSPFNLAAADVLFDPEEITTYELGIKSEWLDHRLRVNAAAYMYDYKNLQVSRIIDTPSGPQTLISNAAGSEINGVDIEILARPFDTLELSLSYGYLDASYDNYEFTLDPGNPLTFDGTRMVRAPEHTLNLGFEWFIPIDASILSLRADYTTVSNAFHEPGEGREAFGSGIPLTAEDAYELLNLRATFEVGGYRISAYAMNVLDEDYRRSINALGSVIVGFSAQPRVYGMKVAYQF
jgi:iron complex outermembrane receptor protein